MAFDYRNKYRKAVWGGPAQVVNRAGTEWCGATNVTSQSLNIQTISCTLVGTADVILLTTRVLGLETVGVTPYVVRSINPGVGFTCSPVFSYAAAVSSATIHWMVAKTTL